MINRVTQQTVQRSTLANLQLNLAKMSDLQSKMSAGKRITKPSDDPSGVAQAMQLRADKRAAEQYSRNATDGTSWLTTIDSALTTSLSSLRRVRDLTVQGASSGASDATSRQALATEIDGIRSALLDQANTKYLGRSVFAGTSSAQTAFDSTTYAWNGTTGATVERRLAPDTTVRADGDGLAAYGSGATSVFALLDDISATLKSGGDVSPKLADIDARMNKMLGELTSVGARANQISAALSANDTKLTGLASQISGVEDIDLAQTIVEIQMQEVAYQGALGATARVLQPTLMDFLR